MLPIRLLVSVTLCDVGVKGFTVRAASVAAESACVIEARSTRSR